MLSRSYTSVCFRSNVYDSCVNLRSIIFKVLFYFNVIRYFIAIMFSPEVLYANKGSYKPQSSVENVTLSRDYE